VPTKAAAGGFLFQALPKINRSPSTRRFAAVRRRRPDKRSGVIGCRVSFYRTEVRGCSALRQLQLLPRGASLAEARLSWTTSFLRVLCGGARQDPHAASGSQGIGEDSGRLTSTGHVLIRVLGKAENGRRDDYQRHDRGNCQLSSADAARPRTNPVINHNPRSSWSLGARREVILRPCDAPPIASARI